ncbi:nucleotidyltransferase family protein [Bordetella petrii]|uniref:nucleotidyltransferase family protein n=1 Tax=Bordetella petrii TaxID=94624 RepID=UPI001E31C65E|nr:nucleotidyltransferase family protein [Bordetella petrii]MCD0502405.1 nucleotidyltransferase family protein [Bordetella petrii]
MSSTSAGHHCVGVLLAAGEGLRYRTARRALQENAHKLLARLPDGRAVVQASASTLLGVLPDSIAVVAERPPELPALLSRLGCSVVHAPAAPRGMGISLATAARHLLDRPAPGGQLPGCVVALADMPWLRPDTLQLLLRHAASDRIVVPAHHGRRGHPVVFGGRYLPELAGLDGDTGARALLLKHGAMEVECDDDGILRDIDTPEDLYTGPSAT